MFIFNDELEDKNIFLIIWLLIGEIIWLNSNEIGLSSHLEINFTNQSLQCTPKKLDHLMKKIKLILVIKWSNFKEHSQFLVLRPRSRPK